MKKLFRLLLALRDCKFYGKIILVWNAGNVVHIDRHESLQKELFEEVEV